MLRFAADHNFDGHILRGIRRRLPSSDIARAVDAGLSGAADPEILAWAAANGRVLLTHDVSTMVAFAYERVDSGFPLSGLIVVGSGVSIGRAIDDLVTIAQVSTAEDWDGQVVYLPL